MSDWYTRKLGGGSQSPAPAAQPAYRPPATPQPMGGAQQPQAPPAESLSEALANPNTQSKGGPAARTEKSLCPSCSSNNYFSRSNAEGARPRCYDCGYPVVQFGSETGEGGSLQGIQG